MIRATVPLAALGAALLLAAAAGLPKPAPAPSPGPSPAHGAELARALGCADCHAPEFTGHKVSHHDELAILHSANLTRALPAYSDAQLRHVLTTGERPDGTRLWYMDAAPYAVLSDADMADLIAFLRGLPPAGEPRPRIWTSPVFDKLVRDGQAQPAAATLANDLAHPPRSLGPGLDRGRHLARTYCAGCHAPSLRGEPDPQPHDPPDLAVAAAYGRADFHALLTHGTGPGGRDVGAMGEAARTRFAALPSADIDALYDYLSAWAKRRDRP